MGVTLINKRCFGASLGLGAISSLSSGTRRIALSSRGTSKTRNIDGNSERNNTMDSVLSQSVMLQTRQVHSRTRMIQPSTSPSLQQAWVGEPLPSHLREEVVYAEWIDGVAAERLDSLSPRVDESGTPS